MSIACHLRIHIIGHSENAPCPNLKKLMFPESTTAIIIFFFPAFKAIKVWGLWGGDTVVGRQNAFINMRRKMDPGGVEMGFGGGCVGLLG
jgi:hypothetical protein